MSRLLRRFGLATAAVVCVALGIQALTGLAREKVTFDEEMLRDHEVMGSSLRHVVSDTWNRQGRDAAVAMVPHLDAEDRGVRIRLVSEGDPTLPPPDVAHPPPPPDDVTSLVRGSWRYTYVPLDVPGASLELRESIVQDRRYLAVSAARIATLLVGLVLGTAIVDALLLDRLVVTPITRLVAHARRVGQGNLGSRSGVDAEDELGHLGRELDQMAVALARVQAEREAAIDQLRHSERLATLGRLAAGVAHELGTPLNVVLARGRSIERWDVASEDEVREYGKIVADQAERMARIIRQLLNFARPGPVDASPCDLRSVVEEVLPLVGPTARKAGVSLVLEPGGPVRAAVDRQGMHQVLLNLVTNALDATPGGGRVTIRVADLHGEVRLWVEDTGHGVPAEQLPHLFEPFFTTKEVGHGTGLGLSVSYGIVRDHGGRIEVSSELGRGTTFVVVLPRGR